MLNLTAHRNEGDTLTLPHTVQDLVRSLAILQSLHDLLSIVQDRPPEKKS